MTRKKPNEKQLEAVKASVRSLKQAINQIEQVHPELRSQDPMPDVTTTIDTILGGPSAVAKRLGVSDQAVTKYKNANRFPPSSWLVLAPEIEAAGYLPNPKLFGMRAPKTAIKRKP